MAKSKGGKRPMSEGAVWLITILTLAVSCAAMSMLISENRQLRSDANETIVGKL